jgi:large subunit ribosomal protein L1
MIATKRAKKFEGLIEAGKKYSLDEAAVLVKKTATAKFDESVELHIHLGIDTKKSEQNVRGVLVLPHGIGKSKKVVVITKGDKIQAATAAGADEAGDADIIEKISKGWLDFDVLVATPDAMKDLTKLAKTLGPKGLMPNPKSGTVTTDVSKTVKELKAGRVEYKADDYGVIHVVVGKASFDAKKLTENAQLLLSTIAAARPASVKGQYIRSISLSASMGPGIDVTNDAAVLPSTK